MRKFVISEDGSVDVGVAQFVKWAMRIIGFTFILQVVYFFRSIYLDCLDEYVRKSGDIITLLYY